VHVGQKQFHMHSYIEELVSRQCFPQMLDTEGYRMRVSVLVGSLVILSLLAPMTIVGIESLVWIGPQTRLDVYWVFVYGTYDCSNQQFHFLGFYAWTYRCMSLLWVSIGLIISLALLFDKFPQSSTKRAWVQGMIALAVQLTSALIAPLFHIWGPTIRTIAYSIPLPLQSILLLVFLAYDWRSRRHRLPNNDRF
jgi:hypothetical protein